MATVKGSAKNKGKPETYPELMHGKCSAF
jgi:hypothetical protein